MTYSPERKKEAIEIMVIKYKKDLRDEIAAIIFREFAQKTMDTVVDAARTQSGNPKTESTTNLSQKTSIGIQVSIASALLNISSLLPNTDTEVLGEELKNIAEEAYETAAEAWALDKKSLQ